MGRAVTIYSMDFNRIHNEEIIVTVQYTISAYSHATWDDPAEGGEVEIISVWITKDCLGGQLKEGWAVCWTSQEDEKWCVYIAENYDHSMPDDCDYYDMER